MRALFSGAFDAFATVDVLAEYHLALHSQSVRSALERVRLHPNVLLLYEEAVVDAMQLTEPGPAATVSDSDDIKFTAASAGARAEYLVTSDGPLLAVRNWLEAAIVTPEAFAQVLAGSATSE